MREETKEEYLARIRKEQGIQDDVGEEESTEVPQTSFKAKLKSWFFLLLFALFLWAILQIFGMLKSN